MSSEVLGTRYIGTVSMAGVVHVDWAVLGQSPISLCLPTTGVGPPKGPSYACTSGLCP